MTNVKGEMKLKSGGYRQPTHPLYIKFCHTNMRFKRLSYYAALWNVPMLELIYELLDEKLRELDKELGKEINIPPIDTGQ